MEQKSKRAALGRGLGALIPGGSPAERKGVQMLAIEEISPYRGQPRQHFDEATIEELAQSIRSKGVLQPVIVRRGQAGYVLVAGERRWRAAQKAGLHELPAMVRELSQNEAFEVALIENIQRADLNPVEEAEAFQRLMEDHGLKQDDLARRIGKERSSISNALRLLRLPEPIKMAIVAGSLTMSHARSLLALEDESDLQRVAVKVMNEGLSVRAVEELVNGIKRKRRGRRRGIREMAAQLRHVTERLQRKLGVKAEIKDRGGAGKVEIHYSSHEELNRLLALILHN